MNRAPHRPRSMRTAILAVALWWLSAGAAGAQTHEFTGRVESVTASQLVVGNRMGDELTFQRSSRTRVRGEKREWKALEPADQVTVHWSFDDNPRQARRVVVLPR